MPRLPSTDDILYSCIMFLFKHIIFPAGTLEISHTSVLIVAQHAYKELNVLERFVNSLTLTSPIMIMTVFFWHDFLQ